VKNANIQIQAGYVVKEQSYFAKSTKNSIQMLNSGITTNEIIIVDKDVISHMKTQLKRI